MYIPICEHVSFYKIKIKIKDRCKVKLIKIIEEIKECKKIKYSEILRSIYLKQSYYF